LDAAAGGAFLSLDVAGARVLINKVVSNQSWKADRQPAHAKGIHEIDSVDRLADGSSHEKARISTPGG
jgi:hypothetical protein